ncbi:chromatin organization modifier domain-containing protein [Hirsutella rhossiliensis]
MTTAYHPQADGLAERRNQTVETALRLAYIEDPNLDWKTLIPSLQWHLNTAYNTSTKTSAHELIAEADELPYIKEALLEVTRDFTDQEGEFYEVDKLLDVRVRKIGRNRKPVTEYLVHWKGWGSMHDQWVRKEEISSKALDEFHGQTTGPRVVRNSKAKGRSESSDM